MSRTVAWSGSRRGELGTAGRVTFHLRSDRPAKRVRFNAQNRGWPEEESDDAGVRVVAAASGGSKLVSSDVPISVYPGPGAADDAVLPPVQALELELPEATLDAIVSFEMDAHHDECGVVECIDIPALIDDLRLE